jgi:hypothetical protein
MRKTGIRGFAADGARISFANKAFRIRPTILTRTTSRFVARTSAMILAFPARRDLE